MKITLCGSLTFINEMNDVKEKLENMGHEALLPLSAEMGQTKEFWQNKKKVDFESFVNEKERRIRDHFEKIKSSDTILVLNYDKNGKENYIGGNTFLEMAIAFEHNKKIFLLNPSPEESPYLDEIQSMKPTVINNDLKKVCD